MAFVHCTRCNWEQDDFWNFKIQFGCGYFKFFNIGWGYNPISLFFSHVFGQTFPKYFSQGYLIPRRIKFDKVWVMGNGWGRNDPHSWFLIWFEFKKMIKKLKKMHWWTENSFRNSKNKSCPKCGAEVWID